MEYVSQDTKSLTIVLRLYTLRINMNAMKEKYSMLWEHLTEAITQSGVGSRVKEEHWC
jgi:hypothetical protein